MSGNLLGSYLPTAVVVLLGILITLREFGFIGKKPLNSIYSTDQRELFRMTKELHEWHNVMDSTGKKIWYESDNVVILQSIQRSMDASTLVLTKLASKLEIQDDRLKQILDKVK